MSTHHEKSNLVQMVQDGQIPSNENLNTELEATKQFLDKQGTHVESTKQQEVLQETKLLVEAAQDALLTKNDNDQVQRLVRDLKAMQLSPTATTVSQDTSKELIEFSIALREFVISLVKSPSFRNELLNTLTLVSDVVGYQKPQGVGEQIKKDFIEQEKPIKESVKESVTQIKESFQGKKWEDLPLEHRIRIREKFKAILKEISANQQSTKAFKRFLRLIPLLKSEMYTKYETTIQNKQLASASQGAKNLVEGFTQGRSLDIFLAKLKVVINLVQSDKELEHYLYELRVHVERGIDDVTYAGSEDFINQTDTLLKNGNYLVNKYQHSRAFQDLVEEAQILLESIKNDQTIDLLRQRVKRVVKSLTYTDSLGKTHLDMEAVSLIRSLVVPFFTERIKEIPIPRVEITHPDFEYIIIDDLFLKISKIVPDSIKIRVYNDLNLDLKNIKTDSARSNLQIKIKGIEVAVKDFYFSFKRQKILSISDEGRADLFITRGGVDLVAIFDIRTGSGLETLLTTRAISVTVHKLKIDIRDAKHKALLNIVSSLFSGAIERQIQKSMEQKLMELSKDLADMINHQVIPQVKLPFLALKDKVQEQTTTL
eukprot:TRINITY_DN2362_c0_g1_i1.p1 TRINITY_DN2362_c0_g1~~TRINITY_DN2362_c0_g1_i1.p1  ORF type:complete len:598 (-),score=104.63 TRINITY_DN2362_c0_g1_i1:20-1813(-)